MDAVCLPCGNRGPVSFELSLTVTHCLPRLEIPDAHTHGSRPDLPRTLAGGSDMVKLQNIRGALKMTVCPRRNAQVIIGKYLHKSLKILS